MRRSLPLHRRPGRPRAARPIRSRRIIDGVPSVLEAERVGVPRLLMDAVRATELVARRHAVELRCVWDPRIGIVLVDARRVHELLCTLFAHAIERSDPRGIVLISAEAIGDEVRFCITESTDHAPGDGPSRQPPLDRGLTPRTEEPLWSTMEELIGAHGGRIWLDSDPGWGEMCCFTLLSTPHACA
jgi:signal transduction histidine kinase